ncbi:MAG: hypothetical protein RBU27_10735 [Bacteroidota bacterium]|jgi:hypothetical protein|nr:hypothetical protein [Bacteroidota bacterium]
MTGCFPNKVAHLLEGRKLAAVQDSLARMPGADARTFTARTKLFTTDGGIYLFPDGFLTRADTLIGTGTRYELGSEQGHTARFAIMRDSIRAMTYYEPRHSFGEIAGTVGLGIFAPFLTYNAVACLVCPKCCFGSCPTIYVGEPGASDVSSMTSVGDQSITMGRTSSGEIPPVGTAAGGGIVAECFSYCVSPFVQRPDLDLLARDVDTSTPFHLRVTNEAMESHFINRLELLSVAHPHASEVYPTEDGRIYVVRGLESVEQARSDDGTDIAALLNTRDDNVYRSGLSRFDAMTADGRRDAITFDIPSADLVDSVTVVLRARNTLLTTALFYDVVLGPRGYNALEWTARMAEDEAYARLFYALYDEYGGVQVSVERDGRFDPVTKFGDIGPIAWKDFAVRLPVTGTTTRVRFTFFPDNLMIDHVAWARETLDAPAFAVHTVTPDLIEDFDGMTRPEIADSVARQDESYLHVTPGDSYHFRYDLPDGGMQASTVLLRSQGYYYEWLRGSWVRDEATQPPLNIFNIAAIIELLRDRWLHHSRTLEEEFFHNRVPLKEKRS